MCQDIGNPRTYGFGGFLRFEAWLVADVWVQDEFAEDLSGGGVDDADVEVIDDQDDLGSGVGASDSDVVHASVAA